MLTDQEVNHIAALARIELNDDMRERMKRDLSKVLDYIDHLNQVDTAGIEPLYQVTGLQNQTRLDTYRGDFPMDEKLMDDLVKQAPSHEKRFLKVKSVKIK